jgi:hypothetical protein
MGVGVEVELENLGDELDGKRRHDEGRDGRGKRGRRRRDDKERL